ncbi:hypothetical protein AVEN_203457-1 [Araneus ventricosus]|uniref:Uncharacterized protein n=1 Tax=Araneus ventricosus TaxID=182803 RepID=A0A4Y2BGB6_ARAVE|nr:hypothetical protein AVEN_203457-1 [Araneus ventricosus]
MTKARGLSSPPTPQKTRIILPPLWSVLQHTIRASLTTAPASACVAWPESRERRTAAEKLLIDQNRLWARDNGPLGACTGLPASRTHKTETSTSTPFCPFLVLLPTPLLLPRRPQSRSFLVLLLLPQMLFVA